MKKLTFFIAFLIFTGMQFASAQTQQVSGNVTSSEDGLPLPGVTILVKGTTTGTVTNLEGNFVISVDPESTILVFSFVGMKKQEHPLNGQTIINIVMDPDNLGLEEVLVVGYGSQIKASISGSITKLSGEKIQNVPVATFESAIQGRTSGVYVANTSGKLGEGMKVRIRGSSSISADNQPLYVVDGLVITSQNQGIGNNSPTNPMADINPSDIESITILKDASAAAIYGSRASNGVVIITTKRGKQGKTNIDIGYQHGITNPANTMDFMNGDQYREFFTEVFTRSYGDEATALDVLNFYIPGFSDGYNTDWQSEAFQQGFIDQMDVSASGGNEKTRFYTGLTYNNQKGILLGNSLKRTSARINLDQDVSKKLKFGMNIGLSSSKGLRVSNDNAFSTPLQLIALPPVQPKIDPETGELNTNTIYFNGLIQHRDADHYTDVLRTIGGVYGEYNILPSLNFTSKVGVDLLNQRENNYDGRLTQDGAPSGNGESRAVLVSKYAWDNYLTFNKSFSDNSNLTTVMGMSYEESTKEVTSVAAIGFPSDDFRTIANASEVQTFWSSGVKFSYLSYFIRANAFLNDRFILGASMRADGSSRFGENNKFGYFPSASAGWILSKESFLENSNLLSYLKLRASWGMTGNSEIGNFAAMGLYTGSPYNEIPGVRPQQIASPDLRWETTSQIDLGLDFGFFNNRLSGEIDVYMKKTTDLLLSKPLPATSGFISYSKNFGKLENKGLEIALNSHNLVGELTWTTNFNIAFNQNKITDLDGEPINSGYNRVEEGESIGVFYLREYAGVDPDNGDALYYLEAGSKETTNDYNLAERQIVGSPNPDFIGGLTNTFNYKGFDLDFLFQFIYGNEVYRNGGHWQSSNGWNLDNQTTDQLNAWMQPGDITDVPRADWDVNNGTRASSRYLEDGSYLRLKTLTLGYSFPARISEKLRLRSMRIYFTGQNLITWTKYTGMDPEVHFPGTNRTRTTSNIQQGVDFYTTPQIRAFTFGLKLGI